MTRNVSKSKVTTRENGSNLVVIRDGEPHSLLFPQEANR